MVDNVGLICIWRDTASSVRVKNLRIGGRDPFNSPECVTVIMGWRSKQSVTVTKWEVVAPSKKNIHLHKIQSLIQLPCCRVFVVFVFLWFCFHFVFSKKHQKFLQQFSFIKSWLLEVVVMMMVLVTTQKWTKSVLGKSVSKSPSVLVMFATLALLLKLLLWTTPP